VKQTYDYRITHIFDAASGAATAKLLKNGISINNSVVENTSFPATEADITAGRYSIEAKDNVGYTTTKLITELPFDDTLPDIKLDVPSAITQDNDRDLTITASDSESYVYSTTVVIDGGAILHSAATNSR